MQIGAIFPQTEIGLDPGGIRDYAQAVSEIGYQHLRVYDHVLGADRSGFSLSGWPAGWPYDHHSTFHEVFVLLGFIAAAAPELELVSGVIVLPQRQTALVAKQAAEIDVLTGGKLRLGVGLGYNWVEFACLGMDFHNRGRRFEEQIEVLRRLFAEPSLEFEGNWHRIPRAGINPRPRRGRIPIWIGGSVEPALRRAARLADGFFPVGEPLEGANWPETIELLRGWVSEAGRDPDQFGLDPYIDVARGTPDEWRAAADLWRGLGVSHMSIVTMDGGLQGPEEHVVRLSEAWEVLR